ncbi:MAG: ornithine carbamoyltransferase [Thermoleophilia bacterium]|nr:ornithine carbamoyltransferase [Thermoleophilia bacterium]
MITRHLLTIDNLDAPTLRALIADARACKADPTLAHGQLSGRTVLLHFTKASTRTRVSVETAVARLGGHPIFTRGDELQLGRGEPIADTANVVSRMCDAVFIRTFAHADVEELARHATIPVVNALTDDHHPLQALADLMTIEEHLGELEGKTIAWVGDGNNVFHSLAQAAALVGMHVRIATPEGYEADPEIVRAAAVVASEHGGSLTELRNPAEAVAGADVVVTDVFVSMGEEAQEAAKLAAFRDYQVDAARMTQAAPTAIFMHCLPAHRGEEVTADVIDGPQSVVWDEAENRLHTTVAVLRYLLD